MSNTQPSGTNDTQAAACSLSFDDEPAIGAELVTRRSGYEHHGLYAGDGRVIHYAGFAKSLHRGPVEEVSLAQFAGGHDVTIRQNPTACFVGLEAVRRARSRLGEDRYRLLTNNCEHFVTWCLFGQSQSRQVRACFAHPRVAWRAVTGLFRAYVAADRQRRLNAALAA
ncbi:lecithin retinol acyltransferase family protein [Caballeronia sp. LP006]|uniref:lecithin retinol acyltransferase family protein n=1 Tax=Caballeronia sp. LP006 TaxID=3038552 RepID=UPI00286745C3|nr:lecithin retinol acyltransferase family protein [Caballeronia sp. LP006]MDR5828709.1 lecithin retinol acyltransferase family protein [Caballeronia sp. LP006]